MLSRFLFMPLLDGLVPKEGGRYDACGNYRYINQFLMWQDNKKIQLLGGWRLHSLCQEELPETWIASYKHLDGSEQMPRTAAGPCGEDVVALSALMKGTTVAFNNYAVIMKMYPSLLKKMY